MGKKRSRHTDETPEERQERKRLKKKSKKQQQQHATIITTAAAAATTTTTLTVSSSSSAPLRQQESAAAATAAVVPSLYYHMKLLLSISLLPCGLRNVLESAKESIRRTLLLKYCNPMGGILLAFDQVQIIDNNNNSHNGRILEELPHIHYNVTCQAIVFCPTTTTTIGLQQQQRLDGIVVETSFHSHVSLIVHGHFNASISSNQMRQSGFIYDETMGQWYHVASQTFLQQQQQQDVNQFTSLEAEDDDNEDENENEQSSPCPPASRIQFTLHKLHEVGTWWFLFVKKKCVLDGESTIVMMFFFFDFPPCLTYFHTLLLLFRSIHNDHVI